MLEGAVDYGEAVSYGILSLILGEVVGEVTGRRGVAEVERESGAGIWDITEGGGVINGREYSQHTLERMAPDIPQV